MRWESDTDWVLLQRLKLNVIARQLRRHRQKSDVQAAIAQSLAHFSARTIMQMHPHLGLLFFEATKDFGQNRDRERGRVADVNLFQPMLGKAFQCLRRKLHPLQHSARFDQKKLPCFIQSQ